MSALCAFSHRGFEDWRYTLNTFDMERWDAAASEIFLQPQPGGLPPLVQRFPAIPLTSEPNSTREPPLCPGGGL